MPEKPEKMVAITPFGAFSGTTFVSKCVSKLKLGPWQTGRTGLIGPGSCSWCYAGTPKSKRGHEMGNHNGVLSLSRKTCIHLYIYMYTIYVLYRLHIQYICIHIHIFIILSLNLTVFIIFLVAFQLRAWWTCRSQLILHELQCTTEAS